MTGEKVSVTASELADGRRNNNVSDHIDMYVEWSFANVRSLSTGWIGRDMNDVS